MQRADQAPSPVSQVEEEEEEDDEDGWQTASDDDVEAMEREEGENEEEHQANGEWEEWDICRCLFDNHLSQNMDLNLDYMFRKFGFYFPDAEYLKDPEGLLKYLVSK